MVNGCLFQIIPDINRHSGQYDIFSLYFIDLAFLKSPPRGNPWLRLPCKIGCGAVALQLVSSSQVPKIDREAAVAGLQNVSAHALRTPTSFLSFVFTGGLQSTPTRNSIELAAYMAPNGRI